MLPLYAYDLTPEQRETVIYAAQLLTEECAGRYGVDFPASPPPYHQPTTADMYGRRYGLFILAEAEVHGYHPAELTQSQGERDKAGGWNPNRYETLVIQEHTNSSTADLPLPADANGVTLDEEGCSGWADKKLKEGAPEIDGTAILNEVRAAVYDSEEDSRVRAAVKEWSERMAGKGYHFASPWDANNHAWPEPRPSRPDFRRWLRASEPNIGEVSRATTRFRRWHDHCSATAGRDGAAGGRMVR